MANGEMPHGDEPNECLRDSPAMPARGFTVVELMIMAAIVLTVAAIAVPGYIGMLNTARITRAVGDIAGMSGEISLYRVRRGALPDSLQEVGLDWRRDPWGNPYCYLPIQGKKGKSGGVRKDRKLVPLNSDYDLYSVGEDGDSYPPITAKQSHDDIIRANNGAYIGLAKNY